MRLTGKIANDGFESVSGQHYMQGHHKIPRIWVVTADRHKIRVFTKPDGHLEQIAEGRPHHGKSLKISNHSLHRIVKTAGGFLRNPFQPYQDPHEKDAAKFTQDISQWLANAVQEDAFDRLVLTASPKVLGDLRKVLPVTVQSRIIAEVNKDLTKMNESELMKELKEIMWF